MVVDIINKYKRSKSIGNLFDRARKEKSTTRTTDRTIERILKKERRTSPEKVAAEINKQLHISLSARNRNVRSSSYEQALYQQNQ